jgi:hypothetical protein
LQVFEPDPFQILLGRQAFDAVGVPFLGAIQIPEPVLAAVGEDDQRRLEVLGVPAPLLFRVVRVAVFPLRFQHAQDPPEPVLQEIVGSPAEGVILELHLLRVEEVPPVLFQRLVDQDAGKGFILRRWHRGMCWSRH